MKYWKKPDSAVDTNLNSRHTTNRKAINVELSAYGLLALATVDNRDEGLLVLKWLTSQRNPNGGFSSTQVHLLQNVVILHNYFNINEAVRLVHLYSNVRGTFPTKTY